jgi:hypothetical protein
MRSSLVASGVAVILLSVCARIGAAPEDYVHVPTGLVFPPQLNGMQRDAPDISKSDGSVGITYRFGGVQAGLTVLVKDNDKRPTDLSGLLRALVGLQRRNGDSVRVTRDGVLSGRCGRESTRFAYLLSESGNAQQARLAMRYRGYVVHTLVNLGSGALAPPTELFQQILQTYRFPCVVV